MSERRLDEDKPETLKAAEAAHDAKINAEPFTGEPGAHGVAVAAGASAGALVGAAMGLVGGPVGVVAGAAAGVLAGGIAGKAAGEAMDPTVEDAYWRENYLGRTYFVAGRSYEDYQPAYRYGWSSYVKYPGRPWSEIEPALMGEWQSTRPTLEWAEAGPATRDAWERLEKRVPTPKA